MNRAYISIIGEVGEQVKLEDIVAQTNLHKDSEELVFLIAGPGGDADEGEDMANLIAGLKQRTITKNVGDIASIDASIYLAGDHRIWDKSKGQFLIHNPWLDPGPGDSKELKQASDILADYENRIAKFISKQTGLDAEATKSLMDRDQFLDNNNLISLGIAHEVIESEFKAVAKYKLNKNEMDNKAVEEKLGVIEALLKKMGLSNSKPKAIVLQDTAGTELNFPDVEQGVDPVEGDKATLADGSAADGPFVMPDGTTYVFAVGELMEIKPAEGDETEALKTRITELEGQLAEATASTTEATGALTVAKTDFETQVTELKEEVEKVKSLVKSDTKPPKAGEKPKAKEGEEGVVRSAYKQKEKK